MAKRSPKHPPKPTVPRPQKGIVCWRKTGLRIASGSKVKAYLVDTWHRRIDGIEIVMEHPDVNWGFIFPGAVPGPVTFTLSEIVGTTLTVTNQCLLFE